MVQAGGRSACRKSHWKCMVINRGRTPPSLRIVHLFTDAAGKARRIRWHDQGRPVFRSAPIAADNREPGDLPSVPGEKPTLGKWPAASTEVVLAERMNSVLPCAARSTGAVSRLADARLLQGAYLSSLIPVLVPGIQRALVFGHRRIITSNRVIHGADAPWLDSCDKHRNEGRRWDAASSKGTVCS
ncbi:hypothetical protein IE4803_CH02542 [Rhizobium etli bv. phaseoli str. IE4803]|nr:hypothetical protein IE4803_CH02542 [Rhizobium etli bv. phaseoli str. IE4803]